MRPKSVSTSVCADPRTWPAGWKLTTQRLRGDRLSVGDGLDGTGRGLASPVSDEAAGCRSRIGERMIRDVVTVGVADDRPRPRLPGIEPQLLLGKVNTALPEDGVRGHGWIGY